MKTTLEKIYKIIKDKHKINNKYYEHWIWRK